MGTLDIRTNVMEDVTEIQFSDASYGYASRVVNCGGYVSLVGINGENQADIRAEDFDNLVAALKKAQELRWGR